MQSYKYYTKGNIKYVAITLSSFLLLCLVFMNVNNGKYLYCTFKIQLYCMCNLIMLTCNNLGHSPYFKLPVTDVTSQFGDLQNRLSELKTQFQGTYL